MATAPYNLARFDLVSIRLAVACAHTGSLTAAAREAHLALAAASRRIRELEDAVGEALFEREGRDFTRFYDAAKRLAALPKEERRQQLKTKETPGA